MEIFFWWRQILAAVKAVHDHNVVHCDLKPQNFILFRQRSRDHLEELGTGASVQFEHEKYMLKLCDFGVSRELEDSATHVSENVPIGTVRYMAPEVVHDCRSNGKLWVGKAADNWSIGVILHQMLHLGLTPHSHVERRRHKLRLMLAIADAKSARVKSSCPRLLQPSQSTGSPSHGNESAARLAPARHAALIDLQSVCLQFSPKDRASTQHLVSLTEENKKFFFGSDEHQLSSDGPADDTTSVVGDSEQDVLVVDWNDVGTDCAADVIGMFDAQTVEEPRRSSDARSPVVPDGQLEVGDNSSVEIVIGRGQGATGHLISTTHESSRFRHGGGGGIAMAHVPFDAVATGGATRNIIDEDQDLLAVAPLNEETAGGRDRERPSARPISCGCKIFGIIGITVSVLAIVFVYVIGGFDARPSPYGAVPEPGDRPPWPVFLPPTTSLTTTPPSPPPPTSAPPPPSLPPGVKSIPPPVASSAPSSSNDAPSSSASPPSNSGPSASPAPGSAVQPTPQHGALPSSAPNLLDSLPAPRPAASARYDNGMSVSTPHAKTGDAPPGEEAMREFPSVFLEKVSPTGVVGPCGGPGATWGSWEDHRRTRTVATNSSSNVSALLERRRTRERNGSAPPPSPSVENLPRIDRRSTVDGRWDDRLSMVMIDDVRQQEGAPTFFEDLRSKSAARRLLILDHLRQVDTLLHTTIGERSAPLDDAPRCDEVATPSPPGKELVSPLGLERVLWTGDPMAMGNGKTEINWKDRGDWKGWGRFRARKEPNFLNFLKVPLLSVIKTGADRAGGAPGGPFSFETREDRDASAKAFLQQGPASSTRGGVASGRSSSTLSTEQVQPAPFRREDSPEGSRFGVVPFQPAPFRRSYVDPLICGEGSVLPAPLARC